MSTRALYTFVGETKADTWNVYKHHDGYPTGASDTIQTTLDYFAWQLPRYEADEFAAAFCAAGKAHNLIAYANATTKKARASAKEHMPGGIYSSYNGGGVRMMPQGNPLKVALKNCSDIEYRYEISQGNKITSGYNGLRIRAYAVSAWDAPGSETLLVDCPLSLFAAWAKKDQEAREQS